MRFSAMKAVLAILVASAVLSGLATWAMWLLLRHLMTTL